MTATMPDVDEMGERDEGDATPVRLHLRPTGRWKKVFKAYRSKAVWAHQIPVFDEGLADDGETFEPVSWYLELADRDIAQHEADILELRKQVEALTARVAQLEARK
jgi:hypothetical protein